METEPSDTLKEVELRGFLELNDFSAFLKKALKLQFKGKKRTNLAAFSRKAGFASRSFVGEVLPRKKKLSRDSLLRIKSALEMPLAYREYFELLAYSSQPHLLSKNLTRDQAIRKLEKLRKRLRETAFPKEEVRRLSLVAGMSHLYQVFAALGDEKEGATESDIAARTRLPTTLIQESLKILLQEEIIHQKRKRFFVKSSSLDFLGLKSHQGISKLVSEVCTDIQRNRSKIIDNTENLIFYLTFSMDRKNNLAFRKRLKEAVNAVVDEYHEETGDTVRRLFFSLY